MVVNTKAALSSPSSSPYDAASESHVMPYAHQVGGHISLSCPDAFHVSKPCSDRELHFYKNQPALLAGFIPDFCAFTEETSPSVTASSRCEFCMDPSKCLTTVSRSKRSPSPLSADADESKMSARMDTFRNHIMLSSLTRAFAAPSVLDLKLGTRQHGDSVSEQKKASHMRKCANSTSSTMGIRLCGMQYYSNEDDEFHYVDKYVGRKIDGDGLGAYIRQFLSHSDGSVRRWVAQVVLQKVRQLRARLECLPGLRLFGASLLIVYDGEMSPQTNILEAERYVEVRVVDFAHATFPGFLSDSLYEGPDEGSLTGLASLEWIISRLLEVSP